MKLLQRFAWPILSILSIIAGVGGIQLTEYFGARASWWDHAMAYHEMLTLFGIGSLFIWIVSRVLHWIHFGFGRKDDRDKAA